MTVATNLLLSAIDEATIEINTLQNELSHLCNAFNLSGSSNSSSSIRNSSSSSLPVLSSKPPSLETAENMRALKQEIFYLTSFVSKLSQRLAASSSSSSSVPIVPVDLPLFNSIIDGTHGYHGDHDHHENHGVFNMPEEDVMSDVYGFLHLFESSIRSVGLDVHDGDTWRRLLPYAMAHPVQQQWVLDHLVHPIPPSSLSTSVISGASASTSTSAPTCTTVSGTASASTSVSACTSVSGTASASTSASTFTAVSGTASALSFSSTFASASASPTPTPSPLAMASASADEMASASASPLDWPTAKSKFIAKFNDQERADQKTIELCTMRPLPGDTFQTYTQRYLNVLFLSRQDPADRIVMTLFRNTLPRTTQDFLSVLMMEKARQLTGREQVEEIKKQANVVESSMSVLKMIRLVNGEMENVPGFPIEASSLLTRTLEEEKCGCKCHRDDKMSLELGTQTE